ncbi:MAG: hypothetical protein NTU43_00965 [Bacteroidetes bacterium]|nr:hypothetical protein [Bacteroidota bacterium]
MLTKCGFWGYKNGNNNDDSTCHPELVEWVNAIKGSIKKIV